MLIYMIRHGQTAWNAEGRLQGQKDIPLNDTGRSQAAGNGHALKGILGDTVSDFDFVASPLGRTRETMEILRRAMGLPPLAYRTDPRLVEVSFGDWEGHTLAELKVETFNFQKFGTVGGVVAEISPDAVEDKDKGRVYRVILRLDRNEVNVVGRLADKGLEQATTLAGAALLLLGWWCLWLGGSSIWWFLLGMLVVDAALQALHISNQSVVYTLAPQARSRINAIYMTAYFLGASIGSTLGSWAWLYHGWRGTSLMGGALGLVTLAVVLWDRRLCKAQPLLAENAI